MPLTKEKRKLSKLIEQSDSEESDHELSYYVNDRIKLMKEVLKVIKPKKIKLMAPSCLKNLDIEEINSMLLEELLGISNKRLKYIFNGQSLDEDSSSSTSEDKPIDVISLDDISDDDLVINVDDVEHVSHRREKKKEHHKCKKEKTKNKVKKEEDNIMKKISGKESGIDSNKNLMSVLELLELQARARAIKSQLLLENAKTQESISLSKIPTLEERVGSDDEVIIKTAKTEEIVITSSDEEIGSNNDKSVKNANTEESEKISKSVMKVNNIDDTINQNKIKIIENKELPVGEFSIKDVNISDVVKINDASNLKNSSNIQENNTDIAKLSENDGIIQINLSDDEMDEMK